MNSGDRKEKVVTSNPFEMSDDEEDDLSGSTSRETNTFYEAVGDIDDANKDDKYYSPKYNV